MTWKCVIDHDMISDESILRLAEKHADGKIDYVQGPLIVHRYDRGDYIEAEPMLRMQSDKLKGLLQSVVDAAWNLGIHPSGVKDYESSNQAQKAHLEDMRSLVKKFTNADLK